MEHPYYKGFGPVVMPFYGVALLLAAEGYDYDTIVQLCAQQLSDAIDYEAYLHVFHSALDNNSSDR